MPSALSSDENSLYLGIKPWVAACCPLSRRARYGVMAGLLGSPALLCQRASHREGRVLVEHTAVGPPEPLSGVVVYKVDRLTRSPDFARLVEIFDAQNVSFVSVTQQFNTTSSMGRLTLNVLLSFAQFEREVTGERIREHLLGTGVRRPVPSETSRIKAESEAAVVWLKTIVAGSGHQA